MAKENKLQPAQHQRRRPGREHKMDPRPRAEDKTHRGSGKLQEKVAIITGGDSGIGRSIAIAFSKEGAHISVVCLEEQRDASETKRLVEEHGRKCLLIKVDVRQEEFCQKAVAQTVKSSENCMFLSTMQPNSTRRIGSKKLPKSRSSGHFGETFSRSFSW